MLHLKFPNSGFPPGGWPFKEPKTGYAFNGLTATLEGQITNVIKHRIANPKLFPQSESIHFTRDLVRQEILEQINTKHPELFVGAQPVNYTNVVVTAKPSKPCVCGSWEADPVYCRSCGGSKIDKWKCKACGKERSK